MTEHNTVLREYEFPIQDIDDLIFGDQTDLCVSER